FSLYHAYKCPFRLFKVLSPLKFNGRVISSPLGWKERLLYVRLCLSYPSQFGTWVGLFPFVLTKLLLDGHQRTQFVSFERILERPHPGALFYERRGRFYWEELRQIIIEAMELRV